MSLSEGVYVGSLIPLNEDLSCDLEELAIHCRDLIDRGCRGVVLFGTTGEGCSFSTAERIEALDYLIADGFDPKKIILANGSSSIPDTIELTRAAVKNQCAAVLIAPPSFFKHVPDEGVIAYYREIIQKTAHPNLRVILYHIPQLSGVPITLKAIQTLLQEFPQYVVGIKESEANLPFAKAIIDQFPGFKVYVGKETHIFESVQHGGAGSICGIGNLYPELICSLYNGGKGKEPLNTAGIDAVFKALQGVSFIPAAKSVLAKRKNPLWSRVRPPLVPLGAEEANALFSRLQASGLERVSVSSLG